jgi:hypothetical protein
MRRPTAFARWVRRLHSYRGVGLFGVVVGVASCAHGGPAAPTPKADAALTIDCSVDDARVYVDDRLLGRAAELRGRALPVPSGHHRVEVRGDGYFTAYRDATVARDGKGWLEVPLQKVPEGESGE